MDTKPLPRHSQKRQPIHKRPPEACGLLASSCLPQVQGLRGQHSFSSPRFPGHTGWGQSSHSDSRKTGFSRSTPRELITSPVPPFPSQPLAEASCCSGSGRTAMPAAPGAHTSDIKVTPALPHRRQGDKALPRLQAPWGRCGARSYKRLSCICLLWTERPVKGGGREARGPVTRGEDWQPTRHAHRRKAEVYGPSTPLGGKSYPNRHLKKARQLPKWVHVGT